MNRFFTKTIAFCTSLLLGGSLNLNAQSIPMYGDLDGSQNVDSTDLTMLSLYLLGDVKLDTGKKLLADCDGDGEINLADLALLKQYILKDPVILGRKSQNAFKYCVLMMNGEPDDEYIKNNNITVVGNGVDRMKTVVIPIRSEIELSEYLKSLGENKYYVPADKKEIDSSFDKYDKAFFENNTLMIFTAYMPDDFALNVDKVDITDENMNVYISGKNISDISLCTLYSWVIKVEVPNEKYNDQSPDCILDSDSLLYKRS